MNFDVKYFLNKFEKIPGEKFICGLYTDNYGNFCALGHCGETLTKISNESESLSRIFQEASLLVASVNDGFRFNSEFGDTPKERIINALTLIDSGILGDI